jgi:hypothetical protein
VLLRQRQWPSWPAACFLRVRPFLRPVREEGFSGDGMLLFSLVIFIDRRFSFYFSFVSSETVLLLFALMQKVTKDQG